MTPNDHANTWAISECIAYGEDEAPAYDPPIGETARAQLNALVAQAETAEGIEARLLAIYEENGLQDVFARLGAGYEEYAKRAEAAEAERDRMELAILTEVRRANAAEAERDHFDDEAERKGLLAAEWKVQHDEMKAERDQLIEQITAGRAAETELREEWLALKAERDHARDALREIAHPLLAKPETYRDIARAALGDKPT